MWMGDRELSSSAMLLTAYRKLKCTKRNALKWADQAKQASSEGYLSTTESEDILRVDLIGKRIYDDIYKQLKRL